MSHKNGLLALSPIILMATLFAFFGIAWGDFYKVPLVVVFAIVLIYAVCISRGKTINERIEAVSTGAGDRNLLMMLWIFLLAGSFAQIAKSMGAIDATVNLTLAFLPNVLVLPGLFLAACFISISIGTSVGTIVALAPIAAGMAEPTGMPMSLLVASTVGGAFFGDNLSFISDTTIVATRSQGVRLSDKFKANVRIAVPAAIMTFFVLLFQSIAFSSGSADFSVAGFGSLPEGTWLKMLPYLCVLIAAARGVNVLVVLTAGNIMAVILGLALGDLSVETAMGASADGMKSMTETILVALMAGGLMELIRRGGGIGYLIYHLTRRIKGKRGAETAIAALVSLTNCCTANNTIAILSVGKISAEIAQRFGVNRCKTASLLDTFSCVVQGVLPYGAQLLIAAGLTGLNPVEIIPNLYYNFILAFVAIGGIVFRYPKKYSL
ncbi:MAG: Na+/H+ antiporter NhaC family protein [Alloprevotella sp.]